MSEPKIDLIIFPYGTKVFIGEYPRELSKAIEGTIVKVIIEDTLITYEIAYWKGKDLVKIHLNSLQFIVQEESIKPTRIGYVQDGELYQIKTQ